MIRTFSITNFKSLVDFEIDLHPQLTLLVGLNGSGKTSVLQAIDFVSHLIKEDPKNWLNARGWKAGDLNSKFIRKSNISFKVVKDVEGLEFTWKADFNRTKLCCVTEELHLKVNGVDVELFSLKNNKIRISNSQLDAFEVFDVDFVYRGSILQGYKSEKFPIECTHFQDAINNARTLELLAPNLMRKSVKGTAKDIGIGGEKLSSFLHHMDENVRDEIQEKLSEFYPNSPRSLFRTRGKRGGAKYLQFLEPILEIKKKIYGARIDATHVNDGMLRMLAIVSQVLTCDGLILSDEFENGVHPEVAEILLNFLRDSKAQVVATTHSPVILNYLEDEFAKKSVQFIYRPSPREDIDTEFRGVKSFMGTQAMLFFDLPSTEERLGPLAAGETLVDVSLVQLTKEAGDLDSKLKEEKNG